MIVVSDATPLIFLGKLNAIHLLQPLYQTVLFSPKVYHETIINGLKYGHPDAVVLNVYYQQNLLSIETPVNQQEISLLQQTSGIDAGEAETIVLAEQYQADLVLIDEMRARRIAREKALRVKGTLGVLHEALKNDIIQPIQFEIYLKQIIQRKDIWISSTLCLDILRNVQQGP
jgi:predicted nucleic acid-binding protein